MPPKSARKTPTGSGSKRGGRTPRGTPKSQAKPVQLEESMKVEDKEENKDKAVELKQELKVEEVAEEKPDEKTVQPEPKERDETALNAKAVENGATSEKKVDDVKESADQYEKGERLDLEDNDPGYDPEEYGTVDYDERGIENDDIQEEGDEIEEEPEEGDVDEEEEGDMVEEDVEDVHEEIEGDEEDEHAGEEHAEMVHAAEEEEHHEVVKERRKRKEIEIFVGGLDKDATEDDLRKVFSKVGEVTEVRLMMNSHTKKNKGFAFLRFATAEQAKRACTELKNPVVNGKQCGVSPSLDNDNLACQTHRFHTGRQIPPFYATDQNGPFFPIQFNFQLLIHRNSMTASSFPIGERAVVALFIARIVFSVPQSLFSESLSLSLLSLLALSAEISVDASSSVFLPHFFKTRPGASSGIFLGAVTLPGVMISKLIQMSRAVSLNQSGSEELENLQLLYWVTSASCCTVLAYLCFVFYHQSDSKNCATTRCSLSCIALYFGVCCVSFAVKSHSGWYTAAILLWLFSHGLAAVKLIQNILHTFPACASIGEALLVTVGLVIYFGDMLACTAAKSHGYFTASKVVTVQYGIQRSEVSVVIQGLIIGLLLYPMLFKCLLQILERVSLASARDTADNHIRRSFVFYISLACVLIIAVPSWMQLVQDFHMHPFLWVLHFVLSEPLKRLSLCIYWLAVIYVSVIRFYNISKSSKIDRILLRKYYHLMAVSMFVPALILQPKFLDLAFGAALAVFLMLEIIRIWRIWPLGQLVHQFMNAFTDHRDTDLLVVSHFSLLLGCALPIWLSSGFNDRPLAPFAGILSLGIGDTMASVVGYKYGVLRWSKTGKKTIEGTAASITSVLAACSILLPLLATTRYVQNWFSLLFAVTISGLLEAYTAQLDNAFIPLVFYSLLCL